MASKSVQLSEQEIKSLLMTLGSQMTVNTQTFLMMKKVNWIIILFRSMKGCEVVEILWFHWKLWTAVWEKHGLTLREWDFSCKCWQYVQKLFLQGQNYFRNFEIFKFSWSQKRNLSVLVMIPTMMRLAMILQLTMIQQIPTSKSSRQQSPHYLTRMHHPCSFHP